MADDENIAIEVDEPEPQPEQPVTKRVMLRGGRLCEVTTYPAGMEIR